MKKATTPAGSAKATKKTPAKRASTSSAKAPKKKAATAAPASTPAPARAPAKVTKTPAPAPAPVTKTTTTVLARTDVGFGNQLFIRGEGPDMSWDKGVLMKCESSDMWLWTSTTVSRPFAYKVLINDEQWSAGDDYVAAVGVENAISPQF